MGAARNRADLRLASLQRDHSIIISVAECY